MGAPQGAPPLGDPPGGPPDRAITRQRLGGLSITQIDGQESSRQIASLLITCRRDVAAQVESEARGTD